MRAGLTIGRARRANDHNNSQSRRAHDVHYCSTYRRVVVGEKDDQLADWLGTTDAAAYLGITPRTLYRLIDDDELRAYRIGRVIRLKIADLDAFIESSRIQPGTIGHLYTERHTG